jgi:hypothetical protein
MPALRKTNDSLGHGRTLTIEECGTQAENQKQIPRAKGALGMTARGWASGDRVRQQGMRNAT